MEREQLQCRLAAARGDCPAELVLKNARIAFVVNGAVLGQVPLPVIPKLRLTTRGVFDVEQQRYLPAVF